eukprot:675971_1
MDVSLNILGAQITVCIFHLEMMSISIDGALDHSALGAAATAATATTAVAAAVAIGVYVQVVKFKTIKVIRVKVASEVAQVAKLEIVEGIGVNVTSANGAATTANDD